MKRVLVFVSCILLFCTSCKKDSNVAPPNTISATIDGVDESFDTNTFAGIGNGASTLSSNLLIYGSNGSATNADLIKITLNLNQTIVKGSYTSGSDAVGFVSILYQHGPYSIVNPYDYTTDPAGNQTTVVITSITDTNIQGTFSGKLVSGSAIKTVTNGKFNLPI